MTVGGVTVSLCYTSIVFKDEGSHCSTLSYPNRTLPYSYTKTPSTDLPLRETRPTFVQPQDSSPFMVTHCTDVCLLELTESFSAMSLSSTIAPTLRSDQRPRGSKSLQDLPIELLLEIYKVCKFRSPCFLFRTTLRVARHADSEIFTEF